MGVLLTNDKNTREQGPLTNQELFDRQMAMLKSFLEHGAITQDQYQTSAEGLRQKMKLQKKDGRQ